MDVESLKVSAIQAIDANRSTLIDLSRSIFDEPEVKFKEHRTVEKLLKELKNIDGIEIEKGVAGLETAFVASLKGSQERPTMAMLAEYDALPKIGHGCGHHLICVSTVGAMIGLAAVMDKLPGRVQIIGTPAEEGGGGKLIMHERGAFDHVDAVYSIHPHVFNAVGLKMLGAKQMKFQFRGKSAHGAEPYQGRSALEAVIQTFVNVNGMRQFVKEEARIHGIIDDGGTQPNIIPESCSCLFCVRALQEDYLDELEARVEWCAKAAALSTETKLDILPGEGGFYRPLLCNRSLTRVMQDILKDLGIADFQSMPYLPGSNDMGTLSHAMPATRAWLKICGPETAIHSADFAKAAISEKGWDVMMLGAKLQALTAIEILDHPRLLEDMKADLPKQKR